MHNFVYAKYTNEGKISTAGDDFAKLSASQLKQNVIGPVAADEAGNLYDSRGNIIIPGKQNFSTGLWLPFTNLGTKSRLVDRVSNIVFANSAVAGGVVIATQAPVSIAIATGVITETGHPLKNGDPIILGSISGAADTIKQGTIYFVVGAAANTYGVATTPNGTALTEVAAHTAIRYSMGRSAVAGAQFNGSDYLQSSATQQWNQQRAIGRLDTLSEDASDCIFIYMELTHGLGIGGTDTAFVGFGRRTSVSQGQGWFISGASAAAQVKLQFEHCSQGAVGNALVWSLGGQLALQGDGFGGSTGTGINTRSIVAISISKMPKTIGADQGNAGAGAGLFYIETAKAGMTDQGYFGQWNRLVTTPPRALAGAVKTEAGECGVGFTVGMAPGGSASTVAKPMIAGQGMDNLIIQRRTRVGGMVCQAVRQGLANYQANPFALPVQPACIAI